MDRIDEIRERVDDSVLVTIEGPPDLVAVFMQKDADIVWLLDRERRLMSVLRVMTDLAEYDGGGVGRKSLDEVLRDYGFSLDEIEANKENDSNGKQD